MYIQNLERGRKESERGGGRGSGLHMTLTYLSLNQLSATEEVHSWPSPIWNNSY